jgi:hypothetical protein
MKLGICHICGQEKELSFEHVPPAAAFNSRPILRTAFAKMLQTDDFDNGARSFQIVDVSQERMRVRVWL